jgi:hypothetical protein
MEKKKYDLDMERVLGSGVDVAAVIIPTIEMRGRYDTSEGRKATRPTLSHVSTTPSVPSDSGGARARHTRRPKESSHPC